MTCCLTSFYVYRIEINPPHLPVSPVLGLFTFGQSGEAHASWVHSRNQFGFQISRGRVSVVSPAFLDFKSGKSLTYLSPSPRPALDKKEEKLLNDRLPALNSTLGIEQRLRPLWVAGRWCLYLVSWARLHFKCGSSITNREKVSPSSQ